MGVLAVQRAGAPWDWEPIYMLGLINLYTAIIKIHIF
jgi:hypothetical protein